MSKLYFRYGPMNSGKSTRLLQDAYNYEERNQRVILMKPTVDTKDVKVLSRLGIDREVDIPISPEQQPRQLLLEFMGSKNVNVDCVLVDEAQFLDATQIDSLFHIAIHDDIPVICYGIRTDFQTRAFSGSLRLLEIAHSLDEMKTICYCGKKALFNARKVNGEFLKNGPQVAIDDGSVIYESLCGECYERHVGL